MWKERCQAQHEKLQDLHAFDCIMPGKPSAASGQIICLQIWVAGFLKDIWEVGTILPENQGHRWSGFGLGQLCAVPECSRTVPHQNVGWREETVSNNTCIKPICASEI